MIGHGQVPFIADWSHAQSRSAEDGGERIQVLHREGVAPKMHGVLELEVNAQWLANPLPLSVGRCRQ